MSGAAAMQQKFEGLGGVVGPAEMLARYRGRCAGQDLTDYEKTQLLFTSIDEMLAETDLIIDRNRKAWTVLVDEAPPLKRKKMLIGKVNHMTAWKAFRGGIAASKEKFRSRACVFDDIMKGILEHDDLAF